MKLGEPRDDSSPHSAEGWSGHDATDGRARDLACASKTNGRGDGLVRTRHDTWRRCLRVAAGGELGDQRRVILGRGSRGARRAAPGCAEHDAGRVHRAQGRDRSGGTCKNIEPPGKRRHTQSSYPRTCLTGLQQYVASWAAARVVWTCRAAQSGTEPRRAGAAPAGDCCGWGVIGRADRGVLRRGRDLRGHSAECG